MSVLLRVAAVDVKRVGRLSEVSDDDIGHSIYRIVRWLAPKHQKLIDGVSRCQLITSGRVAS
jgi:hypothetical protein